MKLVVALAVCALLAVCTQAPPSTHASGTLPPVGSNWRTYDDRDIGFSISYPAAWHLSTFDGCGEAPGAMVSNVRRVPQP